MSIRKEASKCIIRCGRPISAEEIESAQETVKLCAGLSRTELAETICEHWGWMTASGAGKVTACLRLLEELERNGDIQLPDKHDRPNAERVRGAVHTQRTAPPTKGLVGKLADVIPIRLEVVTSRDRSKLWNEYQSSVKIGYFLDLSHKLNASMDGTFQRASSSVYFPANLREGTPFFSGYARR